MSVHLSEFYTACTSDAASQMRYECANASQSHWGIRIFLYKYIYEAFEAFAELFPPRLKVGFFSSFNRQESEYGSQKEVMVYVRGAQEKTHF